MKFMDLLTSYNSMQTYYVETDDYYYWTLHTMHLPHTRYSPTFVYWTVAVLLQ